MLVCNSYVFLNIFYNIVFINIEIDRLDLFTAQKTVLFINV